MKNTIVVQQDADSNEMNALHGESYGVDWVYPEADSYLVTGNYTKQPFALKSSADAYCSGLLATDPDGGCKVTPTYRGDKISAMLAAERERCARTVAPYSEEAAYKIRALGDE